MAKRVRRNEQREVDDTKTLFQYRKLFMTRDDHMSKKQLHRYKPCQRPTQRQQGHTTLWKSLDTFYACTNMADASKRFKDLYSWMRRCRLDKNPRSARRSGGKLIPE